MAGRLHSGMRYGYVGTVGHIASNLGAGIEIRTLHLVTLDVPREATFREICQVSSLGDC